MENKRGQYNKNPYNILQIFPDAEKEVIEAAYRGLSRKYHPDTGGINASEERMKELNWAREQLKDNEKRERWKQEYYDNEKAKYKTAEYTKPNSQEYIYSESIKQYWNKNDIYSKQKSPPITSEKNKLLTPLNIILLIIAGIIIYFMFFSGPKKGQCVSTNYSGVRLGPGFNYDLIVILHDGDIVTPTSSREDGWVEVTLENGTRGWMVENMIICQ